MSPILSADEQPEPEQLYKFVRDNEKIAYGSWRGKHSDIAKSHDIGVPTGDEFHSRLVDDAGWLGRHTENLEVSSNSSTCQLRGNAQEARQATVEVIQKITGRHVERK